MVGVANGPEDFRQIDIGPAVRCGRARKGKSAGVAAKPPPWAAAAGPRDFSSRGVGRGGCGRKLC